jgi:hypothetical protein
VPLDRVVEHLQGGAQRLQPGLVTGMQVQVGPGALLEGDEVEAARQQRVEG